MELLRGGWISLSLSLRPLPLSCSSGPSTGRLPLSEGITVQWAICLEYSCRQVPCWGAGVGGQSLSLAHDLRVTSGHVFWLVFLSQPLRVWNIYIIYLYLEVLCRVHVVSEWFAQDSSSHPKRLPGLQARSRVSSPR